MIFSCYNMQTFMPLRGKIDEKINIVADSLYTCLCKEIAGILCKFVQGY